MPLCPRAGFRSAGVSPALLTFFVVRQAEYLNLARRDKHMLVE
jgi:hypothetical protein